MATAKINTALQNTLVGQMQNLFDVLDIYTGSPPSSANNSATGTLLCSITLPTTPFTAPTSGEIDVDGDWSGTAVATGTAGWARLRNSGDTSRLDGSIGVSGSGAMFIIGDTSIVTDGTVTVASGSIKVPSGE